jgi:hypothetical protein
MEVGWLFRPEFGGEVELGGSMVDEYVESMPPRRRCCELLSLWREDDIERERGRITVAPMYGSSPGTEASVKPGRAFGAPRLGGGGTGTNGFRCW